jgi:hypothetical protein
MSFKCQSSINPQSFGSLAHFICVLCHPLHGGVRSNQMGVCRDPQRKLLYNGKCFGDVSLYDNRVSYSDFFFQKIPSLSRAPGRVGINICMISTLVYLKNPLTINIRIVRWSIRAAPLRLLQTGFRTVAVRHGL